MKKLSDQVTSTGSPTSTTSTRSGSRSRCSLGDQIIGVGCFYEISRHRRRRDRLPRRGRPPGAGSGVGAARAPGGGRPRAGHHALRRRGAEVQNGKMVPGLLRMPATRPNPRVRGRRRRPHVPDRADRGRRWPVADECEQRSRVPVDRLACSRCPSVAVVGRQQRRGSRSATRSSLRHLLDHGFAGSVHPVNPGAAARARSSRQTPTSSRSPTTSTSPCPRKSGGRGRRARSRPAAGERGAGAGGRGPAGSGRRGPEGRAGRAAAGGRSPAPPACAWSGPTAWGSSTPTRRCGSTPAWRR